jgi:hypothetical protein
MSGSPHPVLDPELAWRADLLARMRRASVWLFVIALVAMPFGLLLDNLDGPIAPCDASGRGPSFSSCMASHSPSSRRCSR